MPNYNRRTINKVTIFFTYSLQTFNKYDYVIGLYDPYYHANLTKKSSNYKKYNDIIKKTSATFLQPQPFQRFVLDKKRHITELQKNNLPVVDTKSFPITSKMNPQTMIQKISLYCDEWDTDYFITKPQPGGFGIGFKKWDINKLLQNSKPFNNNPGRALGSYNMNNGQRR